MKSKDQQLLEEAYLSIYKLNENVSPEAEAFANAAMSNYPPHQKKAEEGIIGKYVTVYKAVLSQNFANKSDLSNKEVNDGRMLHSTSSETGRDVVAAGIVKHINWGSSERPTELVLDTPEGEQTVPFGLRNRLEVRKDPAGSTHPLPRGETPMGGKNMSAFRR